jgi:hypothetical protein
MKMVATSQSYSPQRSQKGQKAQSKKGEVSIVSSVPFVTFVVNLSAIRNPLSYSCARNL